LRPAGKKGRTTISRRTLHPPRQWGFWRLDSGFVMPCPAAARRDGPLQTALGPARAVADSLSGRLELRLVGGRGHSFAQLRAAITSWFLSTSRRNHDSALPAKGTAGPLCLGGLAAPALGRVVLHRLGLPRHRHGVGRPVPGTPRPLLPG